MQITQDFSGNIHNNMAESSLNDPMKACRSRVISVVILVLSYCFLAVRTNALEIVSSVSRVYTHGMSLLLLVLMMLLLTWFRHFAVYTCGRAQEKCRFQGERSRGTKRRHVFTFKEPDPKVSKRISQRTVTLMIMRLSTPSSPSSKKATTRILRCVVGVMFDESMLRILGFPCFVQDGMVLRVSCRVIGYFWYDPWVSVSPIALAVSIVMILPLLFGGLRDGTLDLLQTPSEERTDVVLKWPDYVSFGHDHSLGVRVA